MWNKKRKRDIVAGKERYSGRGNWKDVKQKEKERYSGRKKEKDMTHKEKERYSDGGNGKYSTCETKKVKEMIEEKMW